MMTDQRAVSRAVGTGFAPWIVFWVLSGLGWSAVGAGLALAVAAGLGVRQAARGVVRPLEVTALAVFGALSALALVAGLTVLDGAATVVANASLALLAWGSLAARRPFMAAYARAGVRPELTRQPLFLQINARLTVAWAAIFTLNAVLSAGALRWPGDRVWLELVLPQLAIGAATVVSVLFPGRYARRWAARRLREDNPYDWPAPEFGSTGPGARHDVVVIGAGIGGLTAAALLARRGLRVLVLERHFLPGGFCTSWPRIVRQGDRRLRYVFDAGVHDVSGLGPRGPVRNLLRALDLEDVVEWRRVTQEYVLPERRLAVPDQAADFVERLVAEFPAEAPPIRAFFSEMEAIYRELYADTHLTGGVPRRPATVEELLAWPAAHPHAIRWMETSFGAMLDTYFHDRALKQLLSALTGYLSDDPGRLTAFAMAPIFGYYFDGGFYPVGGSQAFADALVASIVAHGGEVRLRTGVRRIVVDSGRVTGVETRDGTVYPAEAVVSNADARRTFLELVGGQHLPRTFVRRIEALEPSASAFMVFLGVDFVPDLAPITVQTLEGREVVMAIPSKVDPSLAPPGHSAVTLITLMPPDLATWDRSAPGYTARRRAFGDSLIEAVEASLPGLRQHIVYRQEGSPATFARYASTTGGAIYGPAIGWRPPVKSPVAGLVLAGSGVFPGAGVEAVVISGTLAADVLLPATVHAPASIPARPSRLPRRPDASPERGPARRLRAGPFSVSTA